MAKMKRLSMLLAAVMVTAPLAACDRTGADRWATTENTNVKIDWDKVNEAYKHANGPEDLEKKINEIYEGSEIISIAVKDEDDKTQIVTGFFDKNTNGTVEEPEKIFTIKREIKDGNASYQTTGHGHYHGYYSPMYSLASGMLMGAMMASVFSPTYVPVYTSAYTTSQSRIGAINSQRSSYRAANPERFQRRSSTGRSYGGGKSSGGTSRSRGGSRFGVRRSSSARVRLTA